MNRTFFVCFSLLSALFVHVTFSSPAIKRHKDRVREIRDKIAEFNDTAEREDTLIDMVIEECDRADQECERANRAENRTLDERGRAERAEQQKNEVEIYKHIIVACSKIEYLEEQLFPKGVDKVSSRRERWIIICNENDARAQQIRDRVLSAYGKMDPKKSVLLFANSLEKIYGDASLKKYAPRNGAGADCKVFKKLREDPDAVAKLLSAMGVPDSDENVKAIRIISEKLFEPVAEEMKVSKPTGLASFTRVKIYSELPEISLATVKKEDVRMFFPVINEKITNIDIDAETITVDFNDYKTALLAINNNLGRLNGIKTYLDLGEGDMS